MFGSLFKLTTNVAKVVTAPIEIAADVANAVVQPIAEGAEELVEAAKDLTD